MFNNQLEFTIDYYNSKSEDLLYSVAVPAEAGATNESVTMNAATMRNTGIELSAAYHNYNNEFKYDISGNLTFPKNRVLSLGMTDEGRTDGYCRTEVGKEVGQFYGYVYEGIYQSWDEINSHVNDNGVVITQDGAQPGDVAYADVNNDGVITDEDRTFIGSGMPKVNFGLSFRFEYKNFDLSIATFGAAGFKVLDFVDMALRSSYGITNKSTELMNAWTAENPSTTVPAVYYKASGSITNDLFSSRYLQNGAYWKISNIELGYNFPDKIFDGYLSNVRVYVSAQNVLTLSKYRGYNIDFAPGTFTPGYNYCSYPTPMSFMVGARLSF